MAGDEREIRISKVKNFQQMGIEPYRERFERTHSLNEAKNLPLGTEGIRVAGRVFTIRIFGRLIFATILDFTGKMQVALQERTLGKENFGFFKKYIDIGDFVGFEGTLFKTKMGEITIDVKRFELLSKALRPLPEKWHGLQDRELKYRQRYLDLIMNEDSRKRFIKRTKIIKSIRDFLNNQGFIEVDTPVLQTKPSGAIATPFVTHHNALNMDLYLRIAPETYLKRIIAGGFERVYEFARCFRNEGIDPSHLQDFTLLEYYVAYWNFEDNMKFTRKLINHVLKEVNGSLILKTRGKEINFDGEWEIITMKDLILRDTGIDYTLYNDEKSLISEIKKRGIELQDIEKMGFGTIIDNLYKKVSRPEIDGPLFIIHHPIELSPLARKSSSNPRVTDRFQLVVAGWEIVNAYSELIDPIDQRKRFEKQMEMRAKGDEETMVMDEDFLLAMEHGMPPMSGWGMGIDRFVALLTNQENLRDVVFFPLVKPID